ncbi:glutathione S-transferase family protein [Parasedimentitalea psychrophila]|uniref:Glutathione S-transferase n=1 Tax=Parasedimentitalea psychrophila TaxID=2997337 RepID=A0A9Y2L2K7_9RHOB|nr:glutathione S-transferase [Parasedimentitalea psychrophila]WIY26978.1 glutathione S-transferase [Parasedimentitalea psychrophila]
MYKLYGSVKSRAFRVLWMLEEIGEPYQLIEAAPHHPDVLALNTSGKIPVLVDGDAVITDSTAIITYLADKHGKLTHAAGTIKRAHQDSLTQMVLDEFDSVLWTAARHSFILPEDRRVPQVKDSLKWEFERNLERLGKSFDGPFLQGDSFTIADITATHCLNWALVAGFPVSDTTMRAYAKEMREREAFKRALAHLQD